MQRSSGSVSAQGGGPESAGERWLQARSLTLGTKTSGSLLSLKQRPIQGESMKELMNLSAHGKPGSRRLNLTGRPLFLLLPASTTARRFKAHSAFSSHKPF